MPIVVAIIVALLCVVFVVAGTRMMDNSCMFLGIIAWTLAVIFLFVGIAAIVNAFAYGGYLVNIEAYRAQAAEERAVYVTMLSEISHLIEQDVTASDTYFDIYDRVINFNRYVTKAEKWAGTWAEGIFCDPSYVGLEVIPLN